MRFFNKYSIYSFSNISHQLSYQYISIFTTSILSLSNYMLLLLMLFLMMKNNYFRLGFNTASIGKQPKAAAAAAWAVAVSTDNESTPYLLL